MAKDSAVAACTQLEQNPPTPAFERATLQLHQVKAFGHAGAGIAVPDTVDMAVEPGADIVSSFIRDTGLLRSSEIPKPYARSPCCVCIMEQSQVGLMFLWAHRYCKQQQRCRLPGLHTEHSRIDTRHCGRKISSQGNSFHFLAGDLTKVKPCILILRHC